MAQGVKSVAPLLLFVGLGFAVTAAAQGDRLLIEVIRDAEASAPQRPAPGLTMDQVQMRFGEPRQRLAPVGEPPISRWEYADFTVYFEHDRVLHAVIRRD